MGRLALFQGLYRLPATAFLDMDRPIGPGDSQGQPSSNLALEEAFTISKLLFSFRAGANLGRHPAMLTVV